MEARVGAKYNYLNVRTSLSRRVVVSPPTDRVVRNNIASIDHYIRTESKIRAAYVHYPQRRRDIGVAHALWDRARTA